jgi:hypothetical protein
MSLRSLSIFILAGLLTACTGTAVQDDPDAAPPISDVAADTPEDLGGGDAALADAAPDAAPDDTAEVPPCKPGEACDDGDPCTADDLCDAGGVCAGTAYVCDDDVECTWDECLGDGGCDHPLRAGWCRIDDGCWEDGDPNPDADCLECITAVATDAWTPDDTNSCKDGDPCTLSDLCTGGVCVGVPMTCPGDGNPCTAAHCDAGSCVQEPADGPCDDGDPCTDGDLCAAGECLGGEAMVCDDGNACTDDACIAGAGCMFASNTAPCDDGNACTAGDACGGGVCQPGGGAPDCDDGNPCTDDSCHPVQGCLHFPNAAPCDDGDPCQVDDFCVGGVCQAGPIGIVCDDGNVCTDDGCAAGVGCVTTPNTAACDDGDVCFSGDQCQGGACQPGPDALACDDGNGCTDDYCEAFIGCQATPNTVPCDDESVCTYGDTCAGGACVGTPISCDDGNPCTNDSCHPVSGCQHVPALTPECKPDIVVTHPPRGATLNGGVIVTVTGTVTSLAGLITSFTMNGVQVPVGPDGSFSAPFNSETGMNLLTFDAEDFLGGTRHSARSYYWSPKWYQPESANPAQAMVTDGIMVFLGPQVWDDNDTSDVDDIATIMTYYMASLDLGTMISNPVTTGSFGWCDYSANVKNITYGAPSVNLTPINGGLNMYVSIPNFKADIEVNTSGFGCPDFDGTATASSITITANVMLSVDGAGNVNAVMQGATVAVNGLNISLSGIWGFLLNWLIDFFEDSFASSIEEAFAGQLGGLIEDTLADALGSLALDETMEIAPFLGDGPPVTLQITTAISSLTFNSGGGTLGLRAKVTAPKGTTHSPLGSIGRYSCGTGPDTGLGFPLAGGQLEMGLHDDFFNQLPYAMYWGGLFDLNVDVAELGVDLSQYGLGDVDLALDFLLPPILKKCAAGDTQVLQIGDMRVDGVMDLYGQPVEMTMYASAVVEADLVVVDGDAGKELSISLGDVLVMEVEITEVSGALAGAEDVLVALVEDQLIGGLLDNLAGDALGSFPIPEIDLSGMLPGLPAGTGISIDIQSLMRAAAYTVLSGNVK